MTVVILSPLLVLIAGLLMYGFSQNGKVQEIGRIMFFVGLMWLVYRFPAGVSFG